MVFKYDGLLMGFRNFLVRLDGGYIGYLMENKYNNEFYKEILENF